MLAYPIILEDDDRTVLATSPGFPELTTFGEDRDEAISRAADAISFNLSTFFRLSRKFWPSKIGWPKALKLRRQSSFSKVVSGVIAPSGAHVPESRTPLCPCHCPDRMAAPSSFSSGVSGPSLSRCSYHRPSRTLSESHPDRTCESPSGR